ncbi:adenylosuccinate synthase [Natrarchaeobius chitinivorans]|uniref:Adenylosuccinate synthetase n=1 Tax=Natrarchaeobius chitinivorans TaxID=1679083 RepID=A0A3N6MQ15_NATCH|nr:adenylosuccinate synthase [Natrarchaeobius chitinivorans]RQG96656.1 adenylosuccinate synthase [Natrarchaeobius chitinivorans]
MNATIIGSQMGDEGKGGIVDVFGDGADVVVRYQGGDNAGHTVSEDGTEYALRLLPSGVVRGKTGVLGNGCVVNLETLFDEIRRLRERGLDPDIRVSGRAHVVLPYHRLLDEATESSRSEHATAVGTTGNGIGPAYEDKASRRGIRIADLRSSSVLRTRLESAADRARRIAENTSEIEPGNAFDADHLLETYRAYGRRLEEERMIVDVGEYLTERSREGSTILFEGAQGTHIDVDHGTFPFVTSSNPTAGGAIVGTGVSPSMVADGHVIGVVKSYLSRVGNGPLPTEFDEEVAAEFRDAVGGFGTVTGRPRRIGWLDLPMLRASARLNGFTGLALNHVDALAGLEELRVCTAYELGGETLRTPPSTVEEWRRCTPRYERFETWSDRDWWAVADDGYDALPAAARAYVEYVRDDLECPIFAVGVGPDREETIVLRSPFEPAERDSDERSLRDDHPVSS